MVVTNQPESSKVETAAVAPDNFLEKMEKILGGYEEKVQSVSDAINIVDAKNGDHIKSINKRYNENDDDELHEDEIRRAVLNETVPASIADAGALAHCGQPSTSTCRKYK